MRGCLSRVLAVAAVCAGVYAAPPAAGATTSPQAFRASVRAAALAQRSVHYVSVASLPQASVSMIGDAGRAQGMQRITFRKSGRTGHVTVLVSAHTAYVRGDAFTLTNFMGFKPRAATKYANTWIVIAHDTAAYAPVAAAVTLASTVTEIGPRGTLAPVRTTTLGGTRVRAVRGTSTVQGTTMVDTVYARATGAPLPVVETATQGANRTRTTFSRWNEPVRVRVPSHSVPIAKVEAAGAPTA